MGDGDGSDGGVGVGDGVGSDGGSSWEGIDFSPNPSYSSFDLGSYNLMSPDEQEQARKDKWFNDISRPNMGNWQFDRAYQGNGSGVDSTGYQSYAPYNQDLATSLGYRGNVNEDTRLSQLAELSNSNNTPWNNPFNQFLTSHGYSLASTPIGGPGSMYNMTQTFGQNGQKVGNPYTWQAPDDKEFGWAVGALASLGGGAAASALGTSAGLSGASLGAATGAGSGFAGAASQTADIGSALKGAALGGLTGGAVKGLDVPGMVGVTDPQYARAINGAIGAGAKAGLTGGNIGSAMLNSGLTSGLGIAGNMGLDAVKDYVNQGNNMGDEFKDYGNPLGNGGLGLGQGSYDVPAGVGGYGQNSFAPRSFDYGSPDSYGGSLMSGGLGLDGGSPPPLTMEGVMSQPGATLGDYGANPYLAGTGVAQSAAQQQKPAQAQSNPIFGMIGSAAKALSAPGRMDNIAGNLMDLYMRNRAQRQMGGMADNLSSMYGPNSPYAQQLQKQLERMDARAGRRTQYGPRNVELQARLAEANTRNAPTLASLYQQQGANRMQMGSDIMRMLSGNANGGGGFGMLRDAGSSLASYFSNSNGNMMGANPASDYNYQNGSDIGFADGGPVRYEPKVGTRGPVRTGGGGGLSPDAIRAALAASTPASGPVGGMGSLPANPLTNPRAILEAREREASLACGGPVRHPYVTGGAVRGPGGPRTDSIPARLSNGEHVMDAASVNAIGGGNNALGQARLNALRAKVKGR